MSDLTSSTVKPSSLATVTLLRLLHTQRMLIRMIQQKMQSVIPRCMASGLPTIEVEDMGYGMCTVDSVNRFLMKIPHYLQH